LNADRAPQLKASVRRLPSASDKHLGTKFMLSKKELLKSIIGKKVDVAHVQGVHQYTGVLQIRKNHSDDSYSIITEVGEDMFEVMYHSPHGGPFKVYYSIHHVIEVQDW
jgi:hypothetical protein